MVEGPKWCGKTTTSEELSNSVLYMSKPDTLKQNLMLVDINPSLLLAGEHGAETLKTLASKIDTDKMKKPAFLMVLTAVGDYAYRREDGIYVVPIGCLKD